MGILLLGNLFWFILWVWPSDKDQSGEEIVASIDGDKITRQEWLSEMESRYGKRRFRTYSMKRSWKKQRRNMILK